MAWRDHSDLATGPNCRASTAAHDFSDQPLLLHTCLQINFYTEREILNHRILLHPHVITFREVDTSIPI